MDKKSRCKNYLIIRTIAIVFANIMIVYPLYLILVESNTQESLYGFLILGFIALFTTVTTNSDDYCKENR